ncbi:hypothetical protein Rsub_01128 [Raphidocelis subcapitata]|uniref:Uncharacterized protein n=1 Tax=Raphidocelis subcapitata TaxID=307507 RepID=A0A2V0NLU4_9CHLO|nr:hypothetical protein Rsub_01128 [Raphidocelis subcapitata]|eukprot:GBF88416.1 hypothetical protein Rsub_01128 [Raphidocelis subcapitata]
MHLLAASVQAGSNPAGAAEDAQLGAALDQSVELTLDVLALILHCGHGGLAPDVRSVCRAWRTAYDATVKHLRCDSESDLPFCCPNLRGYSIHPRPPHGVSAAAAQRALHALAEGPSPLTSLGLALIDDLTELPPAVLALGATLTRICIHHCPNFTMLPAVGLAQLAHLEALSLEGCKLLQLPECIASALPRLRELAVPGNLLTELPPLPGSLEHLNLSYNRIKQLDAAALSRLTALTALSAVAAFSHRPHGESSPIVGALARLQAQHLVHGSRLLLNIDSDVGELVHPRARRLAEAAERQGVII